MFEIVKPLFFVCESPLHAGAGGGVGTELPIQREAHTRFPKVEASGIKGAFREVFEQAYKANNKKATDKDLVAVFGHPDRGDENAGALGLSDGRLLLFPVRSRRGVFAWATCPRVLQRFARDLKVSELKDGGAAVPKLRVLAEVVISAMPKDKCSIPAASQVVDGAGRVMLEEYAMEAQKQEGTGKLANALAAILKIAELPEQFVVVSDEYFRDFVLHCTEIHTRIRIGNDGVVQDGALFTEEHLPAESVLYSLAMAHPEFKKGGMKAADIYDLFSSGLPEIVQIGGNATLGKGIVRIIQNI